MSAKSIRTSLCLRVVMMLFLVGGPFQTPSPAAPATAGDLAQFGQAKITETYGQLPLSFEANQGQTDNQVKFLSRGNGYRLFLTPTEAVLALHKPATIERQDKTDLAPMAADREAIPAIEQAVLRMQFIGANPQLQVAGLEELPGKVNYFIGNDPTQWRTNVPLYAKVRYEAVYPGVDLVYYGNQGQLEYDFVVAPGADPAVIKLGFAGVDKLEVDGQGELVVDLAGEQVRMRKPVIYQEQDGKREEISGGYVLLPTAAGEGLPQVGLRLGRYDTGRPLVIDPVLAYSTYLGGSGDDVAQDVAVDASGNAYVTGSTTSTNFPTASPLQPTLSGDRDVFVTKLNAAGSALVFSTYLGGSSTEFGGGIAVDASGNVYVTGQTFSTDFPTVSAVQPTFGGSDRDAFVAKLNAAGSALVYSTYLGGSGRDSGGDIAVDTSSNAYVVGTTGSPNFPTASPLQPALAGAGDAFVTKLNASGGFVHSTYLGGSSSNIEVGNAIDVDTSGNTYVTGLTTSTDFPTANPLQPTHAGDWDVYVTKLNAAGSALIYSTYLGGSGMESGFDLDVDTSGNAYVTGHTNSTNFPTANPLQPTFGGDRDVFVTKLNAAGSALVYSTYLGGSGEDVGNAIVADASGAFVAGRTASTDFPIANPLQPTPSGNGDTFVTKLNAAGSARLFSTYLGGSGPLVPLGVNESASGIVVDASGNAYVAGYTSSTDFPIANPLQPAYGGGFRDVFLAKIAFTQGCPTPGFAAAANFGAGNFPILVAVGDFNLDGKPDLATANFNSDNASVLLGNGSGGFGVATNFGVGTQPLSVAVGDFNLDGKPDLAAANANSNNVSVLLGNGSGGFGVATNFGVGSFPFSVAVGDFNLDGKPDLATANRFSHNVSVLLGNGSGGFGAATNFGVGTQPLSVAVGDFNLDGKPDLAAANVNSDNVSVLLGDGSGGFGAATNFGAGDGPFSVAVSDFNLDGKPDLAAANQFSDNVSVLLGDGSGGFGAATNFDVGSTPQSVAVGDFNLDGKPDLATANFNPDNVSVLLGNGSGGFGAATNFGAGDGPRSVAVGDFNLDGKSDLVAADVFSNNVSVLLNSCTSNTAPVAEAGGPHNVNEGGSVTVTASGTDPENGPLTYAWDLDNNGSFETPGQSVTFSAAALDGPSSHTITVQVTDNGGLTATDQATIDVLNVAPNATFNEPGTLNEGDAISLSLTDPADPSSGDVEAGFEYAFDCGDGGGYGDFGSSTSASCPTDDDGARAVGGKLRDQDGGETEYTATVTIDNAAPGATFNVPGIVDEGNAINLSLTDATDPSSADVTAGFTYAFDCGDGNGYGLFGPASSVSCPTDDNAIRAVGGKIRDQDSGETEYTATVTIDNIPPTASFANTSGTLIAGQSATLAFSNPFDPSTADTAADFGYSYDCTNDGTFELAASSLTSYACSYPIADAFTARGRIEDKDGDSTDYTVDVTVLTPRQGIEGLIEQVQALIPGSLNGGQGNALIAKLEAAIRQLERGNVATAINQLESFINQVSALISGGILPPEEGQSLIDAANEIIAALGNSQGVLR